MYKGKSILVYLLVMASMLSYSQNPIVNKFRDSTWFAKGVRFDSAIYLIKGASNGKVLTSDASGRATWQTFSASGVSQGTLNDSINAVRSIRKVDTLYRNLDSLVFKINGIRYAIKDSSGGIDVDNFIPLSGTKVGKPVTGTVVTQSDYNTIVSTQTAMNIGIGDDLNLVDNANQKAQVVFGKDSELIAFSAIEAVFDNNNGRSATLQLISDTSTANLILNIGSGVNDSRGFIGSSDFSPNITDLDYTQKIYVDQRISDTATQIRSEIPDVSNFATITNLADTSALLRSLIPTTATFTISKNSAKDSIVTVFNGTRSAVKDSIANLTNYVTTSSTSTLTNKRITVRVDSTTSSATPTINTDNVDTYKLTAQAVDITSFTTNLSGTPTDDQILHIVITGTASRLITWGVKFEASTVALPTTTSGTNRLDVYFIWNTAVSKWRCGGVW